jgi:hypothetical protein
MIRLRLALHDALNLSYGVFSLKNHLQGAMFWLCQAQDAAGGGGVARSFSLRWQKMHNRRGWLGAYPETTGYIIPTFFLYANFCGEEMYWHRAIRMAEWEVEVQMSNGAVQGGTIEFPPTPAVFNTGQVLFGWCRAYQETKDEKFITAVQKAGDFLLKAQDSDGAWRNHGSEYARKGVNSYDARTAWGLLEAFKITCDARYRDSASHNLEFVLSRQNANGWFQDCCLEDNNNPLLHTIAYTMEGLLEAGVILKEPRYIEAARRAADALLGNQKLDGSLAGRFDSQWAPIGHWSCLTGDAQTSIVWLRLFHLTGDSKYLNAARCMNRYLMGTQDLSAIDPGIRGGIKGSHPIWGEYAPYEFLNWAAKFFADALLLELKVSSG